MKTYIHVVLLNNIKQLFSHQKTLTIFRSCDNTTSSRERSSIDNVDSSYSEGVLSEGLEASN